MASTDRSMTRSVAILAAMIGITALIHLGGCPPGTDIGGLFPNPAPNTNDNTQPDDQPDDETPPPDTQPKTGDAGLTGKFISAAQCKTCHSQVYSNWSETRHAKALETLERIGQDKNAVCLACHTVGFGQAGGFVDRATTNSLAGVGCENCHGAGLDHRSNVSEEDLRPPINLGASLCGSCHNGFHHPTHEEWSESGHGRVTESVAGYFAEGRNLTNCGNCHSGDLRYWKLVREEEVTDSDLAGVPHDQMNPVTCVTCHDPHKRTGKAFNPPEGRDFQLRYPEIAFPTPSDSIADTIDPARFNLCGQCHHSRDATWQGTRRPPHGSIQANFFTGEMPVPNGTPSLLPNERTVHTFVPKQCITCHMHHQAAEGSGEAADDPGAAHTGHRFAIDFTGCSTSGCHPTPQFAQADKDRLQGQLRTALDAIKARLGDPATWEYSSNGGPDEDGQAAVPDEIKQIRFLYYYVLNDGSMGVHNPEYAKSIINAAEALLTSVGK